jgi:hypothetical protein
MILVGFPLKSISVPRSQDAVLYKVIFMTKNLNFTRFPKISVNYGYLKTLDFTRNTHKEKESSLARSPQNPTIGASHNYWGLIHSIPATASTNNLNKCV